MAKRRFVNTVFWRDAYIETLNPTEKLLFLYYLTSPDTNLCGAYQLPIKIISIDTGLDKGTITEINEKFKTDEKIFYLNGWVVIPNKIKYEDIKNYKIRAGMLRELEALPEPISQLNCVRWAIHSLSYFNLYPNLYLNLNLNSNYNPNLYPNLYPTELTCVPDDPVVFDSEFFNVTEAQNKTYAEAYPSVDILGEYKKMVSWCKSNPTLRPKSNYPRFIDTWLKKNHNRNSVNAIPRAPAPLPFRNRNVAAEQMVELEKQGIRFEDLYPSTGGKYSDTPEIHGESSPVLQGTTGGHKRLIGQSGSKSPN